MPSASDSTAVKFHTSLNVADLARSVAFYRLLFGIEPATLRADYAKFELADPPLVLALMPGRFVPGGAVNHFGLRVADVEALIAVQQRLEAGSLHTQREEGISCCHSQQTKFWVSDPDKTMWEIYLLHEGSTDDDDDHPHEMPEPAAAVETPRILWQHRIGEPLPARIPHDDFSVHEILLEGTANLLPGAVLLSALLREAHRVLRPGGEVRLHGLTGDTALTVPLPGLPGPAAVVEYVPPHSEIVHALHARVVGEFAAQVGLAKRLVAPALPGQQNRPARPRRGVLRIHFRDSVQHFDRPVTVVQTVGENVRLVLQSVE